MGHAAERLVAKKIDYYSLGIKPQYSFENYVVGPNCQIAAAACNEVAKSPGETYNPIYLYGPAGVGKTHLVQAVAISMLKENPKIKIQYISSERFMSEIIQAISEDNVLAVRQHYSDLDLFVLDEVQYLVESKSAQAEFIHIFNNLHQDNKQVILTGDCSPNQLTNLDKTVRSRLEWGLAVDVKLPNVETRVQILRLKQKAQGLSLSDDVLTCVANVLNSNVRELEGFLKKIHAYVSLSHQELSMDLIQSVVNEIRPGQEIRLPMQMASPDLMAAPGAEVEPPPVAETKAPSLPATPPPSGKGKKPLEVVMPHGPEQEEEKAPPPPPPPPPTPKEPPPPPKEEKKEENVEKKEEAELKLPPETDGFLDEEPAGEPGVEEDQEELPAGFKTLGSVFFYPKGSEKEMNTVYKKFQDVIKKHKLKFRLKKSASQPYDYKGKVNYSSFVDVCKQNKVPIAVVVGPPPDAVMPEQDFYDLLAVTLDVQGVSLQLVNWTEIEKDYKYLNLALDIALVRSR